MIHHMYHVVQLYLLNCCKPLIIIEEECEVLIRDINLGVAPQLPMFLNCVPPSREGILHYLQDKANTNDTKVLLSSFICIPAVL